LNRSRRYCRRCDRYVEGDAIFCPDCGSTLEIEVNESRRSLDLRSTVNRSSINETEDLVVGIEFVGSERMGESKIILCSWDIHFPEQMNGKGAIDSCWEWADFKVSTGEHVRKWVSGPWRRNHVFTYALNISGIGNDNRCAWCKTFRSALELKLRRNGIGFVHEGACLYDY
jgi:hypothetical protein